MSRAFLEAVHSDPWAEEFIDLPSLNAAASDAIEDCIQRVRETARREPLALRSTSLVVLGAPGAGKTHLFSRLRRRLGPRAVFVLVRPLVHAEMTPRYLLAELVNQLARATYGLPQVNALVGSLLAHLDGLGAEFPSAFLETHGQLPKPELEQRLDSALERALTLWPELDESYLVRLLHVPFAQGATQRALLAWLSGRDCEVGQLERIGATASLGEERVMLAIRTLSTVAAAGAPLVVVFDQLENLVEGVGPSSRLLAYAHLTSELVDTMRGMLLVHMALDTEWSRGIEPALNPSQRSRLVMKRQTLTLPSSKEREELLRLWSERIPEPEAPFPWPIGESRLTRLRSTTGLTPRMLLAECRRALDGEPEDEALNSEQRAEMSAELVASGLSDEWQGCLQRARKLLEECAQQRAPVDAARVADGLLAGARFLTGVAVSAEKTGPAKLSVTTAAGKSRLAILAEAHPKSLGSALSKLATLAKDHSIIALRERTRDLPPTWKETLQKRRALLACTRARWVDLDADDAAHLLALDELLQAARSGDVTDARGELVSEAKVVDWVQTNIAVASWKVLRELSAVPAPDLHSDPEPEEAPALASSEHALLTLRRLRVASLERLVREVTRIDPAATRASVLLELESAGRRVAWFGRAVLCVRDAS